MRLRNNGLNVGPTSLLPIIINREDGEGRVVTTENEGDEEGKAGDRKRRKKARIA